jgi:hypothetical protein
MPPCAVFKMLTYYCVLLRFFYSLLSRYYFFLRLLAVAS